jgi:hypothetical protein
MSETSLDGLVDSPRYRALQRALFNVRRQVAQLEVALDQPYQLFSGSPVWVGPTGGCHFRCVKILPECL